MALLDTFKDLEKSIGNNNTDDVTLSEPVKPDEPASEAESMLDKAIKRTEDVIAGTDPFTQQMTQGRQQASVAGAAAQRAAQRQQMTQQGMDAAFQQTAFQQAERDRGTQKAQEAGEIADVMGRRQDAASSQMAELAKTKQYFEKAQKDMELADRETNIQNLNALVDSIDVKNMTNDQISNLTKMGQDIYGQEWNLDTAIQGKWDRQLDKASNDAITHLMTTFGPDSGRDFPVIPGTDIVDWNSLDSESKKQIESWYEAYSQGDDFYDDETGAIDMDAQEWLNNKMNDITITEAERTKNLALKELETAYEPGTPEYDLAKQDILDRYAYAITGRDTEFANENGPLSGEMTYDKVTGEITIIDGSDYDRGGYDEDLGIYGYNKTTDTLTFEDGEEFKVKDGTLQIKGDDGKFSEYTGTDAERIKGYFNKSGDETDAALESAKEGEVFVSGKGELMFKEGGQAVPLDTINPTQTDFKRLMNLDSFENVPVDQLTNFIKNYEGTSYEKLDLTEKLIDEMNFEALRQLAIKGGAHASQEPLTKFRKLYKGQAIELDGVNYISLDEGPRLKDGKATYSRLIDGEGNVVYWVRANGTGNKSGNWSNWVQTDTPTKQDILDKGLELVEGSTDGWMF